MSMPDREEGLTHLNTHSEIREFNIVDPSDYLPGKIVDADFDGAVFLHGQPAMTLRDKHSARNREFGCGETAKLRHMADVHSWFEIVAYSFLTTEEKLFHEFEQLAFRERFLNVVHRPVLHALHRRLDRC